MAAHSLRDLTQPEASAAKTTNETNNLMYPRKLSFRSSFPHVTILTHVRGGLHENVVNPVSSNGYVARRRGRNGYTFPTILAKIIECARAWKLNCQPMFQSSWSDLAVLRRNILEPGFVTLPCSVHMPAGMPPQRNQTSMFSWCSMNSSFKNRKSLSPKQQSLDVRQVISFRRSS